MRLVTLGYYDSSGQGRFEYAGQVVVDADRLVAMNEQVYQGNQWRTVVHLKGGPSLQIDARVSEVLAKLSSDAPVPVPHTVPDDLLDR